jgi:integrase
LAKLTLRYVQTVRDRYGRFHHYFRRPGYGRIMLPGEPGGEEFALAYQAAIDGKTAHKQEIGADRTKTGTINALAVAYYRSAEFERLAPATKGTYRRIIDALRDKSGDRSVATLKSRHIRAMLDAKAKTPSAANSLLKVLKLLMHFAVQRDWRPADPTTGIRKIRTKSEGHHSWSEREISAFEKQWPNGSRERLAFALLLYTAQRRSDVVRMGRQNVQDGWIRLNQQKTGSFLELPIHPALQRELAGVPQNQMTFLMTMQGSPFTVAGFGNWFREVCNAAGLQVCSAHGLRKAAARRLAEAGCSSHQIMAITGHKSLKEVDGYTAAANQRRLAQSAMANLAGEGLQGVGRDPEAEMESQTDGTKVVAIRA